MRVMRELMKEARNKMREDGTAGDGGTRRKTRRTVPVQRRWLRRILKTIQDSGSDVVPGSTAHAGESRNAQTWLFSDLQATARSA